MNTKRKTRNPNLPTDAKLIELREEKGLTEREISAITKVPKTTIHDQLQALTKTTEFQEFASNKDKTFEGLQYKLIQLADPDLLKTMLSKRGFTDVAILQDKIQLLRGQATSITEVDIRHLIANVTCNSVPNVSQKCDNGKDEGADIRSKVRTSGLVNDNR